MRCFLLRLFFLELLFRNAFFRFLRHTKNTSALFFTIKSNLLLQKSLKTFKNIATKCSLELTIIV